MKVTVCFGEVRVLVPCGAGDLLVRDLVREATHRYKKATGQGPESWVEVRALRASSGGILDPDDRVRDVADDRETLAAECAGAGIAAAQPLRHHGGDGASGSSVGTASPDMFRSGCGVGVGGSLRGVSDHGVEVLAADLEGGAGLQVRRGSEPTLHQDTLPAQPPLNDHTKRWSAAVVCREDSRHKPPAAQESPHESRLPAPPVHPAQPFQRQTNRLSMQFSGPGSGVWLDAAERVQTISTKSLPRDSRKEPLGQDTALSNHQSHRVEDMLRWVSGVNGTTGAGPQSMHERPLDRLPEVAVNGVSKEVSSEVAVSAGAARGGTRSSGQLLSVALVKGERGLGFTITTRDNPTGGHAPIYIKNILPKGAAVMDGRLRAGDRLVSVNGAAVSGLAQQQVVSLLRNTPTDSTVTLLVERQRQYNTQRVEPQQSPAKYSEKAVGSPDSVAPVTQLSKTPENGRVSAIVSALNQGGNSRSRNNSKDELNTSDGALQDALNSSNTVLGLRNKLILRLDVPVHDSEKAGLGISVKGKVTVGSDPQDLGIFIKSVLNGGAASRDGRLHTNDQLLTVNGVSLVGQSNAEAMETLRRALVHSRGNVHGNISLTIARRTESMDSLARWKDDTPPSDSSGNSASETSTQHNTVIYNPAQERSVERLDRQNNNIQRPSPQAQPNKLDNERVNGKRHASIVTINNNSSWVSKQSAESDRDKTPDRDSKRDSFEWTRLDGFNPVIDRLTGLRNESYYMATQSEGLTNGHGHLHAGVRYGHMHLGKSLPQHNVIIEEDCGSTVKTGSPTVNGGGIYESGSESAGETAFSRDAVGRRSMSEKRHAAVDAKTTDTYKKIKEQKAINAMQVVGPTLGMRKSSSLESLQTAVQEQQRQPIYSSRHPVPHTPLKHWLTDEHPSGADTMVRGSPQQSSLSHKKPSLLKSLSSMLRFGNKPKKPEEIYGRAAPGRASEKSLSREAIERNHAHAERTFSERGLSERNHSERGHTERNHERGHSEKIHSDRYVDRDHERRPSERRQADRGHDRLAAEPRVPDHTSHRSGASHTRQASADKEERRGLYVQHAPPYRLPPARISPPTHTMSQVMEGAWGATGHYVNYEEIQQNLNSRREKLSEVQIGQMRRTVHAQRAKAEEESRRAGVGGGYHSQRSSSGATRPQSNYYEYESIQPHIARHSKLHYH